MNRKAAALLLAACLIFLFLAERYILTEAELFRNNVLYGSYSYEKEKYSWAERLLLHGTGAAWTAVLILVIPNRKLPVISGLGKNTLPIFLFHGFVIRLIQKAEIFRYTEGDNLLLALVIAVGLLMVFGNPVSAWICKWFFTGHWVSALTTRKAKVG